MTQLSTISLVEFLKMEGTVETPVTLGLPDADDVEIISVPAYTEDDLRIFEYKSSYGGGIILVDNSGMRATDDVKSEIEGWSTMIQRDWIITDVLNNDNTPDIATYMSAIKKIRKIEAENSEDEIDEGNLLCDIW